MGFSIDRFHKEATWRTGVRIPIIVSKARA